MNEISMSNIVGCLGECLCVVRVSAYDMQVDRFDCSPYDWIKKKEQDQKLSAVRSLPLLKIRIVDCDQPVYANTFASSGTKKKKTENKHFAAQLYMPSSNGYSYSSMRQTQWLKRHTCLWIKYESKNKYVLPAISFSRFKWVKSARARIGNLSVSV